MQGIRGVYKASFGPSRARARVYRALALCVVGASQPIIMDIPSSGVPATLALAPLEPYLSPPTPRYALGMSPLASHGCMHAVLRRGYATG